MSAGELHITVRVEIEGEAVYERTMEAGRKGNPRFIAQQVEKGAKLATSSIVNGIIAEYGDIRAS